jgi:hypothetical protein
MLRKSHHDSGSYGIGVLHLRFVAAFLMISFVLVGCAGPLASARLVAPTAISLTATAVPADTATAAPGASTTVATTVAPTPGVTPTPSADDTRLYTSALRPAAAEGLDLDGLTRYRMDVTLSDRLDQVSGAADIRYTNREDVALDRIYLHLYPNLWDAGMTVSDVRVNGAAVEVGYPSGDDVVELPLAAPLPVGESVELSLRFAVPIPVNEDVGNYGEFANRDGVVALAHFYPTVAVYTGGRWHIETPAPEGDVIFHDVSLYDVRLTAPESLKVAATGATVDRVPNADGRTTWHLAGGPMRDFNIAASADYRVATGAYDDITVNSYYLPGEDAAGQEALGWAIAALRTFETDFGPYPYRELDIVATGTIAAGIEYPGMIVIASNLYQREQRQPGVESVVAHETAHQWWYGLVGNDQVNDPWLDEAMAGYSTCLYFEKEYGPEARASCRQALEDRWARADKIDKPVGLPVSAYANGEYSAVVYGRGALFLFALEERIGKDKMAEFLQRYYAAEKWNIATPQQFQALAEEVTGQDLSDIFNQWVYAPS